MNFMKYTVIAAVFGVTLFAGGATLARWGVPDAEHPQGISLRDESVRRSHVGGFFAGYYLGRTHRGGGLRGGK